MNAVCQFPDSPTTVLFVCHDNSRYSLVCEALVRSKKIKGLRAFSAGLDPADMADPFTLSALTLAGAGSGGLWPKHWDGFAHPYRKIVDVVIIIGEACAKRLPRTFPGEPEYIIWDFNIENQLRLSGGVWQDIQMLRPYVDTLIENLDANRVARQEIDKLAAE